MPHISIGMLPGCTPEQKKNLARRLREALASELDVNRLIVSVSVEDIELSEWDEFMRRVPDNAIIIPEDRCGDEKYTKGSCCCC